MEHVVGRIPKGQKASYEILALLKGQTVAKAKTLPLGPGSRTGSNLYIPPVAVYCRMELTDDLG